MGMIHAEILLINGIDISLFEQHKIGKEEIRQMHVPMMVDSGAYMMCINEFIQEILQFPYIEKRTYTLADGKIETYDIVGPVRVKFHNRVATCNAVVLPENSEPLLGAIPMEEMDVLIHPARQELIINPDHPDGAVMRLS